MQDLHGDLAIGCMDPLGHHAVIVDILLCVETAGPIEHATLAVRRNASSDHQPDTAARPLGIEFCNTVPIAPLFQIGVHRSHQQAVLQSGEAKIKR